VHVQTPLELHVPWGEGDKQRVFKKFKGISKKDLKTD